MKTVLALISLVYLTACSSQQAASELPKETVETKPVEIHVRTVAAENRTVTRIVHATGSLQADEEVSMSAEVAGRIASIKADFGQFVRQGDVIAELDKTEFRLQSDRSKAALAQALARLGLGPDQAKATPASTPAIRQARAQHEDAVAKLERARQLVASGDIARERVDELEHAANARKAALEAAEFELRTQLANVQAFEAEVQLAEKRLRDATIVAPFDGQVSERMVSPGQYMKENTPILKLVKIWPLRLRLDVPEVATAAVRINGRLEFTTEAIPGKKFAATITQLNPSLNPHSRSLSAEARLTTPDKALRPGMFVQVELVVDRGASVVAIPKEAVYTVAGLNKAFVIREGKAREVRFTPGQQFDGWIEVPEGVNARDDVAVGNLSVLTDGAAVRRN
jgi:membrane fusion protein (multidrug efflux system)